ncbi:MAG TPA: FAD:protein FMN transferase, partial [Nevskiaceae bacterium]|nr:FAD:protein FMN transferase [Nevskiaceae bacterium]
MAHQPEPQARDAALNALRHAVLRPACARLCTVQRALKRQFLAMGTLVTVTLPDAARARAAADAALERVQRELAQFGRDGWAWGDGALARFNRSLLDGAAAEVPPALRTLFDLAWNAHCRSGGRFEPRVGELVRLWGFDEPAHVRSAPPAAPEIERALRDLRAAPPYAGNGRYGPAPGVAWDFGAIGKGYAVDRCFELLLQAGFHDASIDAGGNLAVRGRNGRRAWRIGIRDPRSDARRPSLLASLEASDEAVITHGDDQRGFEHGGVRYGHILDPRRGWPARGLRSLTVVHADAAWADAAGSALFVAGADWPRVARELGLTQVLAFDEHARLRATPQL